MNEQEYAMPYQTTDLIPQSGEERLQLSYLNGLYDNAIRRAQQSLIDRAIDDGFFDDKQFDQDELALYKARGQAALQYNEIKPTVLWVCGAYRRTKLDWQVSPRTDDDVEPAQVKTKLMKYVFDINKAAFQHSAAFEDMIRTGMGWTKVGYELNQDGEYQITMRHIPWRNVIRDDTSRRLDCADMRYVFETKIVDLDQLTTAYPQFKDRLTRESEDWATAKQSYDYQKFNQFDVATGSLGLFGTGYMSVRKAVRVIECWYKQPERVKVLHGDGRHNGEVYDQKNAMHAYGVNSGAYRVTETYRMQTWCAIFTRGTLLWNQRSPYRHNRIPYIPRIGFIDNQTGMPSGIIRSMRDPQRDLNHRRNKALHLLSTRRVVMDKGAVDDISKLEEEMARPDSIIEKARNHDLQIIENIQLAQPHIDLAVQDSAYIRQISGVTGENMGLPTNATSGVAIQARQEQGSIITTVFFDNDTLARQLEGEQVLSLCEQFMDEPMVFRISGSSSGKPDFVRINDGSPESDITAQQADFIVNQQDYRVTIRQALADQLIQFSGQLAQQTGNPAIGIAMLEQAIELTDIPERKQIISRIRQITGQPDPDEPDEQRQAREQAQAQEQQRQQQIAERKLMAEISKIEAEAKSLSSKADATAVIALYDKARALQEAIKSAGMVQASPQLTQIADDLLRGINSILGLPDSQQQPTPTAQPQQMQPPQQDRQQQPVQQQAQLDTQDMPGQPDTQPEPQGVPDEQDTTSQQP